MNTNGMKGCTHLTSFDRSAVEGLLWCVSTGGLRIQEKFEHLLYLPGGSGVFSSVPDHELS